MCVDGDSGGEATRSLPVSLAGGLFFVDLTFGCVSANDTDLGERGGDDSVRALFGLLLLLLLLLELGLLAGVDSFRCLRGDFNASVCGSLGDDDAFGCDVDDDVDDVRGETLAAGNGGALVMRFGDAALLNAAIHIA